MSNTNTGIEWTDATWNPVSGCTEVSDGCDHCYASVIANRFKGSKAFPHGFKVTLHPERLTEPLSWKKPRKVFVNSMSDLFHVDIPEDFIFKVLTTIWQAKEHTFQVLTKRPGRMEHIMKRHYQSIQRGPLENLWLGTSIESQKFAASRLDALARCPAAVRFVSAEPLLGPLDLRPWLGVCRPQDGCPDNVECPTCSNERRIDWLIAGGESGPGARPVHPDWVRSLRNQCDMAGVPFFFKQWGEWAPTQPVSGGDLGGDMRRGIVRIMQRDREPDGHFREGDVLMRRVGKKVAGAVLDGREWREFPQVAP